MPIRTDIKKILIIGSGPVVIGQGAEFDYSGTQACLAIKSLGYETVLINSNPATIMTDNEIADNVYMEPLNFKYVRDIIIKERPCALLGTFGGQTGLNLTLELAKSSVLEEVGCKIIGTGIDAIEKSEDRKKFFEVCNKINERCIESRVAYTEEEIIESAEILGYPVILRPAYTLGGTGGGVAYDIVELKSISRNALNSSSISQVLVEKYVIGYKEIEYEIIRDSNDTVISVCNMENLDPVGVHTGDSIVVCPSQTLTNKEYQMLRTSAINIIRELKIEGGCNVQFALNTLTSEYFIIEINPRCSRSSALASKACGYPIARVTAMVACGMLLDEIKISNTIASFEPAIDYVVTKMPRFPFDKFTNASRKLNTQMKSTGEVMAIGRCIEESLLKAIRSLEINVSHIWLRKFDNFSLEDLFENINNITDETIFVIAQIFRHGNFIDKINKITKIDRFFLKKIQNIVNLEKIIKNSKELNREILIKSKKMGFSDKYIAYIFKKDLKEIFELRKKFKILPVYKMIDTCASEFNSYVPYFYSTYNGNENESIVTNTKKVIVLGSGPIRIGQGIEFDYSTVHTSIALRKLGFEVIVINSNPSTVSTDYLFSDKLYFEPLCEEDIINIINIENPIGTIVTLGGQTPINLAKNLENLGALIIGTGTDAIKMSEDRNSFEKFLKRLSIPQPKGKTVVSFEEGKIIADMLGFPVIVRPSFVLGGRAMKIVNNDFELSSYLMEALNTLEDSFIDSPVLIDKYIYGKELEVDAICDGEDVFIPGIMEHVEKTGIHSGDSIIVYPTFSICEEVKEKIFDFTKRIGLGLGIKGPFNIQYILDYKDNIYVIEVNPRSSRTIPFLSKACGINIAEISAKVQVGFTLKDQNILKEFKENNKYYVKVPIFSFKKIHEADTHLSPEMKSTGEIISIDENLSSAFYKALISSGYDLESKNNSVLISVNNSDKDKLLPIAKKIIKIGFKIEATKGTFEFFKKNNINAKLMIKPSDGNNEILESLDKKIFSFVINTQSIDLMCNKDGFLIRRKALENGINVFTSLDTVEIFLNTFC